MESLDTIYIGTSDKFAECILHNSFFALKAVICESDRCSDELLTFCLVRNVPLYKISSRNELEVYLKEFGAEKIFIMYSFGYRVPKEKFEDYRIFNVHPSLLPKYKGAQPTYWATVNDETKIGLSLFEITKNFDDGKIVSQIVEEYYLWENESDLSGKLSAYFPKLLEDLKKYIDGKLVPKLNSSGDYYPKVTRKDVYIDLDIDTPALIYNKVRAEYIFGGAKIVLESKTYCIFEMVYEEKTMDELYRIEDDVLYIRYTDALVIRATKFSELEGKFKFRGEK